MSDATRAGWPTALATALAGGLIGSALTLVAAPSLLGEKLVRDALVAHPEILADSAEAFRDRQYAPTLAATRTSFETPYHSSWKGAAKPDVTLTYFYDYACAYCRKSNPDIDRLLSEDKGLRVVYRELPILGPESIAASRVALAASKAGRFPAFHDAMYASGQPSAANIAAAAAAAGVAPTPTDSPDQEAELKANFAVASQLGATGTPLFIVGDKVMNAAVGYDALKAAVAAARAKSS